MTYNNNSFEDEEEKISKFNSAGLINARLEKLWSESDNAMANGDYKKWNIKLDSIWAILGGDEKEGGDVDKKIIELNEKIYDAGSFSSKIGNGFKKVANPNNALQYHLLLKKALFLRRLQNKQGKGTAYANPDEDDWS